MTGARTVRTRWLRDQILAAVRERPGSSTAQIERAVAAHALTARAYDGQPFLGGVTYSQVYQHLRALDRAGVIRWQRWTEVREADPLLGQLVRWWPVTQPDDDLEAIAALSCVEPTRGERE